MQVHYSYRVYYGILWSATHSRILQCLCCCMKYPNNDLFSCGIFRCCFLCLPQVLVIFCHCPTRCSPFHQQHLLVILLFELTILYRGYYSWEDDETFTTIYHCKNRRVILTQLKASQLQLSVTLYGHRSPVASLIPRLPLWALVWGYQVTYIPEYYM